MQFPVNQPCPSSGGSLVAGEAVSLHTLPAKRAGILVRWVAIAMGKVSEAKSILMDSAECSGDHHLRSGAPIARSGPADRHHLGNDRVKTPRGDEKHNPKVPKSPSFLHRANWLRANPLHRARGCQIHHYNIPEIYSGACSSRCFLCSRLISPGTQTGA